MDAEELTRFAHEVIMQPGVEDMFPRVQRLEVEVSVSD